MREIRTEIVLEAPPEAVWDVLTDLEAYEEWNPRTVAADGTVAEGEQIALTLSPQDARERTFGAEVVDVDPARRLEWVATVWSPWVFSARRTFELEPLEERRTRFVNRETFRGVLVRFALPDDAEADYEAVNQALAERLRTLEGVETAEAA